MKNIGFKRTLFNLVFLSILLCIIFMVIIPVSALQWDDWKDKYVGDIHKKISKE